MPNLRRVAAAGAAIAFAAAVTVAAPAHAGTTHTGRCGINPSHLDNVLGGTFSAFLYAVVAVHSGDPAGNPAGATVTCELRVPDRVAAAAGGTGAGAVVVFEHVWFTATEDEELTLCTVVDFADATPTATECGPLSAVQIPPQVVYDTLDSVLDQVWPVVDPPVCAALASWAPGFGPVLIDDEGDVSVWFEGPLLYSQEQLLWDCPPYDVSQE